MPRWAAVVLSVAVGVAVVVVLGVVFIGGGDEPDQVGAGTVPETETITPPATETRPPPQLDSQVATLGVIVRGGRPVRGIQQLAVREGDRVRIQVTSDERDRVHVHGYDLMRDVGPGRPATFTFRATIPGRFEIELEDRGTPIAELEVRP